MKKIIGDVSCKLQRGAHRALAGAEHERIAGGARRLRQVHYGFCWNRCRAKSWMRQGPGKPRCPQGHADVIDIVRQNDELVLECLREMMGDKDYNH